MGDVVNVGIKRTVPIGGLSATVTSDDAFGVLKWQLGFMGLLLVCVRPRTALPVVAGAVRRFSRLIFDSLLHHCKMLC